MAMTTRFMAKREMHATPVTTFTCVQTPAGRGRLHSLHSADEAQDAEYGDEHAGLFDVVKTGLSDHSRQETPELLTDMLATDLLHEERNCSRDASSRCTKVTDVDLSTRSQDAVNLPQSPELRVEIEMMKRQCRENAVDRRGRERQQRRVTEHELRRTLCANQFSAVLSS